MPSRKFGSPYRKSGSDRLVLPVVREWSGDPPGCPGAPTGCTGVVKRVSRMFGSGPEAIWDVRE